MSPKAPIRLLNIRKYPDVFKALLLNAHVIAEDLKEHYLIEAIFAFSQFLPKYAFPVNLDVVDKVAKVSNWITNALMMIIRREIFESILTERRPLTMDEMILLGGKAREWNIRPKAGGMQYRRGF